jgi:hypothetical protein
MGIWAAVAALCLVCVAVALGAGEVVTVLTVIVCAITYGIWWVLA